MNAWQDIEENIQKIDKIVLSSPVDSSLAKKLEIRPIATKSGLIFQAQHLQDNKAFHQNFTQQQLESFLAQASYGQLLISTEGKDITYFYYPGGKCKRKVTQNAKQNITISPHNRQKQYLLQEEEKIPALVDLGVFDKGYKIIKSKYDKYKQINRFVEIVDDQLKNFDKKEITVLDFGCGKSYLTFILYYYLSQKLGLKTTIRGYDLKQDVVENCNKIAKKYNYAGLSFEAKDVAKQEDVFKNVDVVVTLHACDTATDYALYYALKHRVKYIFSVPCCQHQINKTISCAQTDDFALCLNDGIIKERFCALLTMQYALKFCANKAIKLTFWNLWTLLTHPKTL